MYWLGVDTGGTFTDFVLLGKGGVRIHKVLSTPAAPEQAVLQGIHEMGLTPFMTSGKLVIVHGTTVATNAALEGKGARTLFVTNRGIEDILLIGRQTRPALYELRPRQVEPVLRPEDMLGIDCRRGADGSEVIPLRDTEIDRIVAEVNQLAPDAVAISLLFSWLDDAEERRLEQALVGPGRFVCRSSAVLPLAGEYERGVTTWLNAWLGPKVADYLARLNQAVQPAPLSIMQSHGGTLPAEEAARGSVNLLLSGPAGGLCAAADIASRSDRRRLMTFDMGGTSTDVALIDGDLQLTLEGRVGPWPVAVPMVDMHTIGAGGGSIARVDTAGMLHVGPASAGAEPGPACYARGGLEATVTDANLVLGYLPASQRLGGNLPLDQGAAREALERLGDALHLNAEEAARGVLALANEHMTQALRVISIQRGHDPANFTLVSFGGAGGLHVCALAESLGMHQALVPANSGVLSAEGLIRAPRQRELLQALPADIDDAGISAHADALAAQGRAALLADGCEDSLVSISCELLLCYRGQSFQLNVPWQGEGDRAEQAFHELHEKRYGHRLALPVSRAAVRVQARAETELPRMPALPTGEAPASQLSAVAELGPVPLYQREQLGAGQRIAGPALICEKVATTWLAPGWQLEVDDNGHLWIERLNRSSR